MECLNHDTCGVFPIVPPIGCSLSYPPWSDPQHVSCRASSYHAPHRVFLTISALHAWQISCPRRLVLLGWAHNCCFSASLLGTCVSDSLGRQAVNRARQRSYRSLSQYLCYVSCTCTNQPLVTEATVCCSSNKLLIVTL